LQCRQVRNPPPAEALPRQQSDFDLGLIEPASMLGSVVHGEAVPDFLTELVTEQVSEGLAAMDVQIVHNQVNRSDAPVLQCDLESDFGELKCRSVWSGKRKMASSLRLYSAEDVGGAAALVLIILSGLASRFGR
jgi:hypothetical protein